MKKNISTLLALTLTVGFSSITLAATAKKGKEDFTITLKKNVSRKSFSRKKDPSYLSSPTQVFVYDAQIKPLPQKNTELDPNINYIDPLALGETEEVIDPPFTLSEPVLKPSVMTEELTLEAPAVEKIEIKQEVQTEVVVETVTTTPAPVAPVIDPRFTETKEATVESPVVQAEETELDTPNVQIAETPVQAITTTQEVSTYTTTDKGVRIAFLKPTLKLIADAQNMNLASDPTHSETGLDSSGVSVGYAYLPVQRIGFTSNVAFIQVSDGGSATLGRLDGNVALALTNEVDLKAGVNGSKFLSGNKITALYPYWGYQASMGIKVYKNIGVDVGYVQMTQWGQVEQLGADILMQTQQKGMEFTLHTTF